MKSESNKEIEKIHAKEVMKTGCKYHLMDCETCPYKPDCIKEDADAFLKMIKRRGKQLEEDFVKMWNKIGGE